MLASVDLITTGRPDLTAVAEQHGYLRGTRLDDLPRYERAGVTPAFVDMHWDDPDPDGLLRAVQRHAPKYVVAGDYDGSNHAVINARARRLDRHAENVIVVPHHNGDLAHVPEWAVIGYSTPSDYAATEIPLRDYRDASQSIHVLGGTPHQQHRLLSSLWTENVVSMDCNSHHKAATIGAKAWYPRRPHWRKIDGENAVEEAYSVSIQNLRQEHEARGLIA